MCLVTAEEQGQQQQKQDQPAGARDKLYNASRTSAPLLSSSSISTSLDSSSPQPPTLYYNVNPSGNTNVPSNNTSFPSLGIILLWSILTFVSKEFSVFLPKFQSQAGAKTFIPAAYHYDAEYTFFDNTILTWGTDYAICIIMIYAAYLCLRATTYTSSSSFVRILQHSSQSKSLRIKSACLFLSYAISVFAGGYAHYTFTGGVEQLNTLAFRIWWTICVGSVTAAGGFMGACGSEICKRIHHNNSSSSSISSSSDENTTTVFRLVYVHDVLWVIYGGYLTWVCIMGGISYKRPACDIFVAGTSQFVPTMYCILSVMSVKWEEHINKGDKNGTVVVVHHHGVIRRWFRYMFYIGFALNAPLLPSYPCYIQYTSLSLGVVNAILHLNLTLAWGMQALSLRHFCQAFNLVEDVEVESSSSSSSSLCGSASAIGKKKDE